MPESAVPEFSFELLRRWPDIEAPNLVAVDATDRLILDEAAELIAAAQPGSVVVLGDRYGALTLGAISLGAQAVRVHQDSIVGERALAANADRFDLSAAFASLSLGADLLVGARLVVMQLPRSLAELDEWAALIARHAEPDVVVVAGGRIKHMTPAMNDVLGRSFEEVTARLARQKSRALIARRSRPVTDAPRFPQVRSLREPELPGGELTVSAHGGAFAGATLDIGTRHLLTFLPQILGSLPATAKIGAAEIDAIDLGSGTGVLAASLALSDPRITVVAIDQSAAAVLSTTETAQANGIADRVLAVQEDALSERPDASADLILCNPPFHSGAAVHADVAVRMLAEAARVLRPGGTLWTVYNSHLGHASALRRLVGQTDVVGRNTKFSVTVTRPVNG